MEKGNSEINMPRPWGAGIGLGMTEQLSG